MNSSDIRRKPERWQALQELVKSGVSLNEIRRTLGVDHRTVKRHFPEYQAFPVGGAGEAAEIRKANEKLRKIIRTGKAV